MSNNLPMDDIKSGLEKNYDTDSDRVLQLQELLQAALSLMSFAEIESFKQSNAYVKTVRGGR